MSTVRDQRCFISAGWLNWANKATQWRYNPELSMWSCRIGTRINKVFDRKYQLCIDAGRPIDTANTRQSGWLYSFVLCWVNSNTSLQHDWCTVDPERLAAPHYLPLWFFLLFICVLWLERHVCWAGHNVPPIIREWIAAGLPMLRELISDPMAAVLWDSDESCRLAVSITDKSSRGAVTKYGNLGSMPQLPRWM